MLSVGVKLQAEFTNAGEFLADVSALEAAGAHSIWFEVTGAAPVAPWILLGAISAVTQRIRLGVMLFRAAGWPPAIDLLERLSAGRLVVGVENVQLPTSMAADAPFPSILMVCNTYEEAKSSAALAGGLIFTGGHEDVRALRADPARDPDSAVWAEVPIPQDRAGWAKAVAAYETAGATGIIVGWNPRIIDLLRSAAEPDDRMDLLIATG